MGLIIYHEWPDRYDNDRIWRRVVRLDLSDTRSFGSGSVPCILLQKRGSVLEFCKVHQIPKFWMPDPESWKRLTWWVKRQTKATNRKDTEITLV